MILILTEPVDHHADHLVRVLRERGADFRRFDTASVPAAAELSLSFSAGGRADHRLRTGIGDIDLGQVRAVWFRRPGRPEPHDEIGPDVGRRAIVVECQTALCGLWTSLECRWVPGPPSALADAELKVYQLSVAGQLGFELPPTLVTNSPDDFLDFYRRHNGRLISKMVGSAFFFDETVRASRFTEPVSTRDVGYADAIRYCPLIVQAEVPKRVELRVTVVGRRLFAAAIDSQQSCHTRLDWRHYDLFRTAHVRHDLPADVAERCVRLAERLGLCYGAIDLILTPDGRYVFLEINPNGQFLWVEELAGLPITEALCDLLTGAPGAGRAA